jgi:hypothetical protein
MSHCSVEKYIKIDFSNIISLEQYYIHSLKGLKRVLHRKGLLQRSVVLTETRVNEYKATLQQSEQEMLHNKSNSAK